MPSVLLLIDRPGLIDALIDRGVDLAQPGDPADAIVARQLSHAAPCLVLADSDTAAVALLDAGADDVVARHASPALIAARVAALIRRSTPTIRVGDLAIDTVARRVVRGGRPIALLPREYALLLHLARRPGVTVSHAALREAVWGLDFDPGTNVIAVHVSRLRAKLGAAMLLTDKGRGYRLVSSPEIASHAAAG